MPIVGWIIFAFIAFTVIVCAVALMDTFSNTTSTIAIWIVTIAILLAIGFGMNWYYENTEKGKRVVKDQESNLSGGITRQVDVYDMEGDLITSYKGTFDVEMNDTHILFDDEKGDRHVIYFTTGTVTIDEISDDN